MQSQREKEMHPHRGHAGVREGEAEGGNCPSEEGVEYEGCAGGEDAEDEGDPKSLRSALMPNRSGRSQEKRLLQRNRDKVESNVGDARLDNNVLTKIGLLSP